MSYLIIFYLMSVQNDVTLHRGWREYICHDVITQTNQYDKQAVIL